MNSDTNNPIDIEPVQTGYEDSIEGVLQFHADRSLYFQEQSRSAKTSLKRDYYKKKLVKNNQKLWKLLVRTPNSYNPLMKYLESAQEGTGSTANEDSAVEEEGQG